MPRRDNLNLSATPIPKDLRNLKDASDSYDKDNVFLTDQGWVYRHFKKADKSQFWDEIIVAGEVDLTDSDNDPTVAFGTESVSSFETGDGTQDFEYASGGTPSPSPSPTPTGPASSVTLVGTTTTQSDGSITAQATTSNNGAGLTVTYDASGGVASNLAIGAAGADYEDGDSFTVDGDTGVTGTVAI